MLDEKKLRKRILFRFVSSPATLLPFLAGATVMAWMWAVRNNAAVGLFAGLAGLLVAAGSLISRLIVRGETAAKDVLDELQQESSQAREAALDALDTRLVADGDPRTENALRDIRAFTKAFAQAQAWTSGLNSRTTFDILEKVNQLVSRCIQSLEQTLALWQTARDMRTPAARQPILDRRERIVEEITRSIDQLGRILVEFQNFESGQAATGELARVRQELDQSLSVARAVDDRMRRLESELSAAYEDEQCAKHRKQEDRANV